MSNSNSTKNLDEIVAQEKRRHRDKLKKLRDDQKSVQHRIDVKAFELWSTNHPDVYAAYVQCARYALEVEREVRAARAREARTTTNTVESLPDDVHDEQQSGDE